MLKDLFIINESGLGIYEYHIDKSEIELQLVAGLITALIEFSRSTLLDSMQVIHLEHGKLVITTNENTDLFFIGIYDSIDHDVAVQRANNKIMMHFLEHNNVSEYEYIEEYNPIEALKIWKKIPQIMENSNRHTFYVGIISILILSLIYFTNNMAYDVLKYGMNTTIHYLYLYLMFGIPYFIIGFFTGNRKHGTILSFILNTILTTIMIFQIIDLSPNIFETVSFSGTDLSYGVSLIFGFFGGYVSEFIFIKK